MYLIDIAISINTLDLTVIEFYTRYRVRDLPEIKLIQILILTFMYIANYNTQFGYKSILDCCLHIKILRMFLENVDSISLLLSFLLFFVSCNSVCRLHVQNNEVVSDFRSESCSRNHVRVE